MLLAHDSVSVYTITQSKDENCYSSEPNNRKIQAENCWCLRRTPKQIFPPSHGISDWQPTWCPGLVCQPHRELWSYWYAWVWTGIPLQSDLRTSDVMRLLWVETPSRVAEGGKWETDSNPHHYQRPHLQQTAKLSKPHVFSHKILKLIPIVWLTGSPGTKLNIFILIPSATSVTWWGRLNSTFASA